MQLITKQAVPIGLTVTITIAVLVGYRVYAQEQTEQNDRIIMLESDLEDLEEVNDDINDINMQMTGHQVKLETISDQQEKLSQKQDEMLELLRSMAL